MECQFRASKPRSSDEIALIARALTSSIADPDALTTSPESFGLRIRLLHLCMQVLHAAHAGHASSAPEFSSYLRAVSHVASDSVPVLSPAANTFVGSGVCLADGRAPVTNQWPYSGLPERKSIGSSDVSVYTSLKSRSLTSFAGDSDIVPNTSIPIPSYNTGDATIGSGFGSLAAIRVDVNASNSSVLCNTANGLLKAMSGDGWVALSLGSLKLFRERILRAALLWFAQPQAYAEPFTSPERVRDDFEYIAGVLGQACFSVCL